MRDEILMKTCCSTLCYHSHPRLPSRLIPFLNYNLIFSPLNTFCSSHFSFTFSFSFFYTSCSVNFYSHFFFFFFFFFFLSFGFFQLSNPMDLITELQKEIGQLTQLMFVTIGTLQREAPPARLFENLKRGSEMQGGDENPDKAKDTAIEGQPALAAKLCEDVV